MTTGNKDLGFNPNSPLEDLELNQGLPAEVIRDISVTDSLAILLKTFLRRTFLQETFNTEKKKEEF